MGELRLKISSSYSFNIEDDTMYFKSKKLKDFEVKIPYKKYSLESNVGEDKKSYHITIRKKSILSNMLCKLGFHSYFNNGSERVKGLYTDNFQVQRNVKKCSRCGKVTYLYEGNMGKYKNYDLEWIKKD
jgi:hypothetical protein